MRGESLNDSKYVLLSCNRKEGEISGTVDPEVRRLKWGIPQTSQIREKGAQVLSVVLSAGRRITFFQRRTAVTLEVIGKGGLLRQAFFASTESSNQNLYLFHCMARTIRGTHL
jgi:hypothetical protein